MFNLGFARAILSLTRVIRKERINRVKQVFLSWWFARAKTRTPRSRYRYDRKVAVGGGRSAPPTPSFYNLVVHFVVSRARADPGQTATHISLLMKILPHDRLTFLTSCGTLFRTYPISVTEGPSPKPTFCNTWIYMFVLGNLSVRYSRARQVLEKKPDKHHPA